MRSSNLALSMRAPDKVAHFRVVRNGRHIHIDHGEEHAISSFLSLDELVNYYRNHNPDDKGGLPCKLTSPLPYRGQ